MTVVRAHQHAAGARQKGPRPASRTTMPSDGPGGGLTTKIHLAADSHCRPMAFVVTPGQTGEAPAFPEVISRLRVPRPIGRPRTTPDVVLASHRPCSTAHRTWGRVTGPTPTADMGSTRWGAGRPVARNLGRWHHPSRPVDHSLVSTTGKPTGDLGAKRTDGASRSSAVIFLDGIQTTPDVLRRCWCGGAMILLTSRGSGLAAVRSERLPLLRFLPRRWVVCAVPIRG